MSSEVWSVTQQYDLNYNSVSNNVFNRALISTEELLGENVLCDLASRLDDLGAESAAT